MCSAWPPELHTHTHTHHAEGSNTARDFGVSQLQRVAWRVVSFWTSCCSCFAATGRGRQPHHNQHRWDHAPVHILVHALCACSSNCGAGCAAQGLNCLGCQRLQQQQEDIQPTAAGSGQQLQAKRRQTLPAARKPRPRTSQLLHQCRVALNSGLLSGLTCGWLAAQPHRRVDRGCQRAAPLPKAAWLVCWLHGTVQASQLHTRPSSRGRGEELPKRRCAYAARTVLVHFK